MRLGIYMGIFDPPHKGHMGIVDYLLKKRYVDKVLIIPTMDYRNKHDLTDIRDRINMVKIFENDRIMVDTTHNANKYTYKLIRELKCEYNDEFYLIIGADNIVIFDKWKHYQELLQNKIIVVNRDGIDIKEYAKKYDTDNFIVVDDYPRIDISSTLLRKKLDSKYLDGRVLKYIKQHHLYE